MVSVWSGPTVSPPEFLGDDPVVDGDAGQHAEQFGCDRVSAFGGFEALVRGRVAIFRIRAVFEEGDARGSGADRAVERRGDDRDV